jgi:PPOX class probable F420-dependent enzyme
MATIPASVRELLATGPLVTLATIDEDGSPYLTLTLADVDGDEIVCATFFELDQRKLRNMRRDPRVAISFAAKEHAGEGLHPYVSIKGRARITEGGALEVMDSLAPNYFGPGAVYPMRDVPPGVVIHVTVEEISGQGPWREA